MLLRAFALAVLALAPSLALAHHGRDFLLLESPGVPHPGDAYFIVDSQFALDDAEEQVGFEPSLLVGVTPRIALELHAHTEKLAGESWNYEATAAAIHVLLTDPGKHHGWQLGLSAEHEIAAADEAPDNTQVRLSAEHGGERVKWVANLVYARAQGDSGEFGAALGVRRQLNDALAIGVEARGSFEHAAGSEVLAAAYWEHGQSWVLKFGLGAQKDEAGDFAPVAHVGILVKLH